MHLSGSICESVVAHNLSFVSLTAHLYFKEPGIMLTELLILRICQKWLSTKTGPNSEETEPGCSISLSPLYLLLTVSPRHTHMLRFTHTSKHSLKSTYSTYRTLCRLCTISQAMSHLNQVVSTAMLFS